MRDIAEIILDIYKITGQNELKNTMVFGIEYTKLSKTEMEYIKKIIIENQKKEYKRDQTVGFYQDLLFVYGVSSLNSTAVNGVHPKDFTGKALELLYELFLCVEIRTKEKISVVEDKWTLNDDQEIKFEFDYHPMVMDQVRSLGTANCHSRIMRDENGKPIKITRGKNQGKPKKEIWWTAHVSELPELKKIFGCTQIDCEKEYIKWRNKNLINKLVIDNKHGYLYGFELPYEQIDYATSFPIKGANFSSAFKEGYSDGRDHLYEAGSRKFPRGMFNKVKAILDKHKTEYIFEDNRTGYIREYDWEYKGKYQPRDYQREGFERILRHRTGIEQLATGAGKTILAGYTTAQIGVTTIFFVHTKFLLKQAKDAFSDALQIPIGQIGDGVIDIQPVTVAMVQTVIRAYGEEYDATVDNEDEDITDNTDVTGHEEEIKNLLEKRVKLVYFDECQFVGANSFYSIANKCNAVFKVGLSATPYRSDGKDMKIQAALGEVIHKVTASYLIQIGVLMKPKIKFIKINNGAGKNDKRVYQKIYKEEIVENELRNEISVNEAIKLMSRGKSVLLLVQQIKHGELLQKLFEEKGYEVDFTAGKKDPKAEQRNTKVKKLFRKERLALIASTIADEGLDIQTLDAIILCGGGKSPSKAMQRVGRGLRKIDVVGFTKMFKEEDKNVLVVAQTEELLEKLKVQYAERDIHISVVDTEDKVKDCIEKLNDSSNNLVLVISKYAHMYKESKLDVVFATYDEKGTFNWKEIEQYFEKVTYKFQDKDNAYVVEFIDCAKYLFDHSKERRDMYATESEFDIHGWGDQYRNRT